MIALPPPRSGRTSEYDMVAAAYRVVRLDMSWGSVEAPPACGSYNFTAYDAAAAAWIARGVTPFYVLDYWTPCYDGGNGCTSQACIEGYANFGAAAMAHFAGRKMAVMFECQNEPQGERTRGCC